MKQRRLLPDGDYSLGSPLPFLADTPECVAQAIMTRLRLESGEWFLDRTEGTRYEVDIIGHNTAATRDLAVRTRILGTPGVLQISEYASYVRGDRAFVVFAVVDTEFGRAQVQASL